MRYGIRGKEYSRTDYIYMTIQQLLGEERGRRFATVRMVNPTQLNNRIGSAFTNLVTRSKSLQTRRLNIRSSSNRRLRLPDSPSIWMPSGYRIAVDHVDGRAFTSAIFSSRSPFNILHRLSSDDCNLLPFWSTDHILGEGQSIYVKQTFYRKAISNEQVDKILLNVGNF